MTRMLCSIHLISLTESSSYMIPNWSRFPAPRRLLILLKDNSFFKYLILIFNILISLTYLICWYDSKLVEVSGSPEAVNGSSVVLPWNAFQMGQSLMAPVSPVQWNRPVLILLNFKDNFFVSGFRNFPKMIFSFGKVFVSRVWKNTTPLYQTSW